MVNVTIHAAHNIEWQGRYAHHAKAGLLRHGINARVIWNSTPQTQADVSIIMGPNMYKAIERSGIPYLMFNRKLIGNDPQTVHENCAVGWDGFNGRATFCVKEIDPNRLLRYINLDEIEEWKDGGQHILLCEQSDVGRSTEFKSINDFYTHAHNDSYATNQTILFRKKPVGEAQVKPALVKAGFKNSKAVAVLNSTISVEALMAGYPVISYDKGDPVYSITGHSMAEIVYPETRLDLFQYMAHCQWTQAEIANGDFWHQLYPKQGIQLHEWTSNANL